MTRSSHSIWAILVAGLMLASCQPLPQPFVHEVTPEAALPVAKDFFGVRIEPTTGLPTPMAVALDNAMVAAFEEADIPAAIGSGNQRSLILRGTARLTPAGATSGLEVTWVFSDRQGQEIGSTRQQIFLSNSVLTPAQASSLAHLAVPPLTRFAADASPTARPEAGLAIGSIDGAPGDGKASLARAIEATLRQHNIAISDRAQANSRVLLGSVDVEKPKDGKQKVSIRWVLMQPDGSEVGAVEQHNEIPAGLLDKAWGETAFEIANAAFDGIVQLMDTAKAQGEKRPD